MDEIEKTKTGVYDAQSLLAEANSFPKIKSRQLTSHEREEVDGCVRLTRQPKSISAPDSHSLYKAGDQSD